MSIEQWAELLHDIDKRKPKKIIIDGMFSIANILSREVETKAAIESLADKPLVLGSFAAPGKLPYRQPLDLESQDFQIEKYLYSRRSVASKKSGDE